VELSAKTIEHFRNPQNVGEIENPEGTGSILKEWAIFFSISGCILTV